MTKARAKIVYDSQLSILHEDATSTTLTFLPTTLTSASKRALCDPRLLGYDPPGPH